MALLVKSQRSAIFSTMSKSLAASITTAKRVARAFYEVCAEAGQVEPGLTYLERLARAVEEEPELARLIENPALQRDEKENLLKPLLEESQLLFKGLNGLLIEYQLLGFVKEVCQEYRRLWDQDRGIFVLKVRTCFPLGGPERQKIKMLAERKMGGKCLLEEEQDPELLGGMVLQFKSWVFDQSFKQKLEDLSSHLKGVHFGRRL